MVKKLDDVLQDKGKIVFLKIDVEGHESAVLDGANEFLHKNQCIIQIELFPENKQDLTEKLNKIGYTEHNTEIIHDSYFANFPITL